MAVNTVVINSDQLPRTFWHNDMPCFYAPFMLLSHSRDLDMPTILARMADRLEPDLACSRTHVDSAVVDNLFAVETGVCSLASGYGGAKYTLILGVLIPLVTRCNHG